MNLVPPLTLPKPCIVRRRYKREWEFSIVNKDNTYSPFGTHAPRGIKWVYQTTWQDKIQRIHTVTEDEWIDKAEESKCWWTKPFGSYALPAIEFQSKERE